MDVQRLIDLLPRGLYEGDEEARRALEGLLGPVGLVDDYLDTRARALPELLDAAKLPDDLIRHLAAMVGLGPGLDATAAASPAELRKLIPVAVRLWKVKGTRPSWRGLVASLSGSRPISLEWFDLRTVHGTGSMAHVIPGPSGSGGYYSTPERVTDLWYHDPPGTYDDRPLRRLLALVRPANERINLYKAWLVDDLGIGASLWRDVGAGVGSWSYDADAWTLSALDGYGFTVALDDLPAGWTDYHATLRLAVTGAAWIRIYDAGDDDHYAIYVDQVTGEITLLRNAAGVTSGLALYSGPTLTAGHPYLWAVEAWEGFASTRIVVYREGARVIDYVDSDPARPTSGGLGWGTTGAGDVATLSAAIVWPRGTSPTRIGPNP